MTLTSRFINVILGLIIGLLMLLLLQTIVIRTSPQNVLLGVIAGLILMAVLTMQPNKKSSQSIEYKLIPSGTVDQSVLDRLGKEGWRLVCIDPAQSGYIFRR